MKEKQRLRLSTLQVQSFTTSDLKKCKGAEAQEATLYTCDYFEAGGTLICCKPD